MDLRHVIQLGMIQLCSLFPRFSLHSVAESQPMNAGEEGGGFLSFVSDPV